MNATTQTTFASEANSCNMKEVVMQALGAQKQIISKGCDDAVLCSPRFLTLLFNKREKWIQFLLEVDFNSKRRGAEVIVALPNEAEPTTFCKMEIKMDIEFKEESINMNWKNDPSSHSIKTQHNLITERDREDEISLGVEELLTPSNKVDVGDMRDQGDKITHMELLDPSTEMGVDVTLHDNLLQHEFSKRRKTELNPPLDLAWNLKDSHLIDEEWENENHNQSPKRIESNIESVLASDSTTNDELRRTFIKNKYPFLKECFVSVKRLPRELAATDIPKSVAFNVMNNREDREIKDEPIDLNLSSEPNPEREFKIPEETKEHMETLSRRTIQGLESQRSIRPNDARHSYERIRLTRIDYASNKAANLTRNIKPVHKKIKLFTCLECNYSCCHEGNFADHMKSVHDNIKPFKCFNCNNLFGQSRDLLRHIKSIHEIIKPFNCSLCNFSCSRKDSLVLHIKSVHEKIKPFKCLKCNYSCSRKYILQQHIKSVHEKIKPFKCSQ